MPAWAGLGQAATVAQLVGVDAGGLISMILQAAVTARQNRRECEQLARRVFMVAELLPHLQDPEVARRPELRRALDGLGDALRSAHDLVASCQGRNAAYRFVMAGRQAERFRDVQSRIDFYISVFPLVSHIAITGRLDRLHNFLTSNRGTPSPGTQLESAEVELTFPEIIAPAAPLANDMSALETTRGAGGTAATMNNEQEPFWHIISPLRYKHILALLSFRRKEEERQLVCEYTNNGTLRHHLHGRPSSPVISSWRRRVEVLLGSARAVARLHHAVPPVTHRHVSSSSILLDASWTPRVSDGSMDAVGYLRRQDAGHLKLATDVYNLGAVMLEVLTGRPPVMTDGEVSTTLVCFALPFIQAGQLPELLDRRPQPEPTLALDQVAQTAARCLRTEAEDRPPVREVVAKIERALNLMSPISRL